MKKLVVLMLVVGLASLASATATMSIGGGGTFAPGTTSVTLNIAGSFVPNDDSYWQITSDIGTITGGAVTGNEPTDSAVMGGSYPAFPGPAGEDGPWGSLTEVAGTGSFSGIFFSGFSLGGLSDGDVVTVTLTDSSDFVNVDASWTTTVTIIPEPMTMALLGLGGLFLRRKK